mmetsp:Transcript_13769/g.44903  ORF Transcript_13769/g.44903 Transcript_13769/m.44903 type:complete len:261 (+) Transcript_13769:242-1024(+)
MARGDGARPGRGPPYPPRKVGRARGVSRPSGERSRGALRLVVRLRRDAEHRRLADEHGRLRLLQGAIGGSLTDTRSAAMAPQGPRPLLLPRRPPRGLSQGHARLDPSPPGRRRREPVLPHARHMVRHPPRGEASEAEEQRRISQTHLRRRRRGVPGDDARSGRGVPGPPPGGSDHRRPHARPPRESDESDRRHLRLRRSRAPGARRAGRHARFPCQGKCLLQEAPHLRPRRLRPRPRLHQSTLRQLYQRTLLPKGSSFGK